jgi:hypothetical protein
MINIFTVTFSPGFLFYYIESYKYYHSLIPPTLFHFFSSNSFYLHTYYYLFPSILFISTKPSCNVLIGSTSKDSIVSTELSIEPSSTEPSFDSQKSPGKSLLSSTKSSSFSSSSSSLSSGRSIPI